MDLSNYLKRIDGKLVFVFPIHNSGLILDGKSYKFTKCCEKNVIDILENYHDSQDKICLISRYNDAYPSDNQNKNSIKSHYHKQTPMGIHPITDGTNLSSITLDNDNYSPTLSGNVWVYQSSNHMIPIYEIDLIDLQDVVDNNIDDDIDYDELIEQESELVNKTLGQIMHLIETIRNDIEPNLNQKSKHEKVDKNIIENSKHISATMLGNEYEYISEYIKSILNKNNFSYETNNNKQKEICINIKKYLLCCVLNVLSIYHENMIFRRIYMKDNPNHYFKKIALMHNKNEIIQVNTNNRVHETDIDVYDVFVPAMYINKGTIKETVGYKLFKQNGCWNICFFSGKDSQKISTDQVIKYISDLRSK